MMIDVNSIKHILDEMYEAEENDFIDYHKHLFCTALDYSNSAHKEQREMNPTASEYLSFADEIMQARAEERDSEDGERSMMSAVAAFNMIYGHELSETEGWQFMSLLKKARSAQGKYREDDHIDDIAYAALAAESAREAR